MFEGTIKKLDLANLSAVVEDEKGERITVKFAQRTNVEVAEDETVGWIGGDLEDLEVGEFVELELTGKKDDGTFMCDSVVCIS